MISIFVTFMGFIIAVSIFLYFLSGVDATKRGVSKLMDCEIELDKKTIPVSVAAEKTLNNLSAEEKNYIPGRKCPLCSRILRRDEPLYATHIETAGIKKVLIHGCPYCYKDAIPE